MWRLALLLLAVPIAEISGSGAIADLDVFASVTLDTPSTSRETKQKQNQNQKTSSTQQQQSTLRRASAQGGPLMRRSAVSSPSQMRPMQMRMSVGPAEEEEEDGPLHLVSELEVVRPAIGPVQGELEEKRQHLMAALSRVAAERRAREEDFRSQREALETPLEIALKKLEGLAEGSEEREKQTRVVERLEEALRNVDAAIDVATDDREREEAELQGLLMETEENLHRLQMQEIGAVQLATDGDVSLGRTAPMGSDVLAEKRQQAQEIVAMQRASGERILLTVQESYRLHQEVMELMQSLVEGSIDQLDALVSGAPICDGIKRPQEEEELGGGQPEERGDAEASESESESESSDISIRQTLTRCGKFVQCLTMTVPCLFQCVAPLIPRGDQWVTVVDTVAAEGGRGIVLEELEQMLHKLSVFLAQVHFKFGSEKPRDDEAFREELNKNFVIPLSKILIVIEMKAAASGAMQLDRVKGLLEFEKLNEVKTEMVVLSQSRGAISNRTWNNAHNKAQKTIQRTIELLDITRDASPGHCVCENCCCCCQSVCCFSLTKNVEVEKPRTL